MTPLLRKLNWLAHRRQKEVELQEELQFHLDEEAEERLAKGLSADEARRAARKDLGNLGIVREDTRAAWSWVLLEQLIQDIRYASRTFRLAPLSTLTIVLTIALGLGLITAVFATYNAFAFHADAVQRADELFGVAAKRMSGPDEGEADLPLSRLDYEALRHDTNVFVDVAAMRGPEMTRVDGRSAASMLVSGNFFQMLGVDAAIGRPFASDDEQASGEWVIVLSHAGWRKLFASDPAVLGRRALINGTPCTIVGVMPDGFRGLALTPPDYWAPLAFAAQLGNDAAAKERAAVDVVGRLKSGILPGSAAAALHSWVSTRSDLQTLPVRPIRVTLTPRNGLLSDDAAKALLIAISPLCFAFGLILLIGCANVANLLLARGIARQREIGIRLSLGASRQRIVRQLLTESLMVSLASCVLGLVVADLFLHGALFAVITTLPPEVAQFVSQSNVSVPVREWRVVTFVVLGAIVATAWFALVPALHSTRLDLVRTMRGEVTKDARPGRARYALITVQVCASALLAISAGIFLRSALAAATQQSGVNVSDTVRVSLANESSRAAVLRVLSASPLITTISASSAPLRGIADGRLQVGHLAVSPDYFDVLGLSLVSGRNFTSAERSAAASVAIVSEALARQLWPNEDGVGQQVRFEGRRSIRGVPAPPSHALTVVGIVRDPARMAGFSYLDTFRGVYVPSTPETPGTSLMLRVRDNPDQARVALLERLTAIDPALTNITTLRTIAGMQTYVLRGAFWLTVVLGGLALVLTASGLFGVLSYVVQQQSKEIGVRMALGATTKDVAQLVLSQSIRPVGIGLVAGSALTAAVAVLLMALPEATEISGWIRVFDPVAYALGALLILASCALAVSGPTLNAARIDPIVTLRN